MTPQFHLSTIQLADPVTVLLPLARPRVVGGSPTGHQTGRETILTELDCSFWINVVTQTIHAQIALIPRMLLIYGGEDFAAACADPPDQHAKRVLQILGDDPASALQTLIDGREMPTMPPRIPRSIRSWQAREMLRRMDLLESVEDYVSRCGDTAVIEAWEGRENLARCGKTVLEMAAKLGMTEAAADKFFIDAAKIEV